MVVAVVLADTSAVMMRDVILVRGTVSVPVLTLSEVAKRYQTVVG